MRSNRGAAQQPDIRPELYKGKTKYRLMESFKYTDDGVQITVPVGFRLDGASTPRWAWSLTGITRDGLHRAAALLHDWIYEMRGDIGHTFRLSRRQADSIFYQVMIEYGVPQWKAYAAFLAVRVFGRFYWDEV